jgi:hypothetical protein
MQEDDAPLAFLNHIWNGFGFEDGDDSVKHKPRCKRCAYLEILRGEIAPELATRFFDENPGWC